MEDQEKDKQKQTTKQTNLEAPVKQQDYDFSDIDQVVKSLSRKKIIFCQHFAKTLNRTQSAIASGSKQKSAGVIGCNYLKDVKIQKYINYLLHLDRMEGKTSKEDIIRQCVQITQNYRSSTAKMSALNLIAKLQGLTDRPSIFGDNNQITITIKKKSTE